MPETSTTYQVVLLDVRTPYLYDKAEGEDGEPRRVARRVAKRRLPLTPVWRHTSPDDTATQSSWIMRVKGRLACVHRQMDVFP